MRITIFDPRLPGFTLGEVNEKGKGFCDGDIVAENIVRAIEKGIGTPSALRLRTDVKHKGKWLTLGDIFAPKKNRGTNIAHKIQAEHRYKGKVDWQKKKKTIQRWLTYDKKSLAEIASLLGVTKSTLSKANVKYDIYPKRSFAKVSES